MNVLIPVISALLFFSSLAYANSPISQCLTKAKTHTHRLEKEQAVENCFQSLKSTIIPHQCLLYVNQALKISKTIDINETLNTVCFYEKARFKTPQECTTQAQHFKISDNYDEAIFECYRQFQSYLSKKECKKLADKMIFPMKKSHLKNQCENQ